MGQFQGSISRMYNTAKSWTKHLAPAFLPVFQFTFLWVMRPTERRIPALRSLAFCLKWNLAVRVELIVVERPRLILSVRWLPHQLTEPQDYWLRVMDTQLNGETLREKEMLVKLLLIRHTMDARTHTHTHTHKLSVFFRGGRIIYIWWWNPKPHLNKCILQGKLFIIIPARVLVVQTKNYPAGQKHKSLGSVRFLFFILCIHQKWHKLYFK